MALLSDDVTYYKLKQQNCLGGRGLLCPSLLLGATPANHVHLSGYVCKRRQIALLPECVNQLTGFACLKWEDALVFVSWLVLRDNGELNGGRELATDQTGKTTQTSVKHVLAFTLEGLHIMVQNTHQQARNNTPAKPR